MNTETVTQNERKIPIDTFASDLFNRDVLANVIELMKREADNVNAEMAKTASEQVELLQVHRRYEELSEKYVKLQKRLMQLSAVVGDRKTKSTAPMRAWEAAALYLDFVQRARISELLEFLEWSGITTSRQALEYAVASHKRFRVTKSGREKYVSLRK